MSMRIPSLLAALALTTLSACGQDESANAAAPAGSAMRIVPIATSPMPALIAYASWNRDIPFFAYTVTRAGVILTTSPDTAGNYRAYGVDANHGTVVFQIELTYSDLVNFNANLATQMVRASLYQATNTQPSEPMSWGIFGQIAPPPPNPPIPLYPYDVALAQRIVSLAQNNLRSQIDSLQQPLPSGIQ